MNYFKLVKKMIIQTGISTKKSVSELIQRITMANDVVEKTFAAFMELRSNRDIDKEYYGDIGLEYIRTMVKFQNVINNSIAKLWWLHQKEIKDYHQKRIKKLENDFKNL